MEKGMRPGPKPKGPFADKRATLATRITDETRQKLDQAAAANGRSLSQEVEVRIEESFQYGGPRTAELLRRLAAQVETWPGGDEWLDDPRGYQWVRDLWDAEIKAAEPRPDVGAFYRRVQEGEAALVRLTARKYATNKKREEDIALIRELAADPKLSEFHRHAFQTAIRASTTDES